MYKKVDIGKTINKISEFILFFHASPSDALDLMKDKVYPYL